MSDAYTVGNGVTVTPQGGGWYEVSHSTLSEPEKIQGKENADARALAVSQAAHGGGEQGGEQGGGSLPAQGSDLAAAQVAAGISAAAEGAGQSSEPQLPEDALSAEEVAQLRASLQEQAERAEKAERERDQLEGAVEQLKTKTVVTDGGEVPQPARVPAGVPRRYEGKLDDKEKARLAKAGLNIVTIVLEENENIPPTGLFVGHNGRGYMIVPGEEVDVPDFLLNVLNDAVMSAPVVDSKTQKVLGFRNRSRYPYRRV